MLPEIPADELAAALQDCVEALLWEAGVKSPPIDAVEVAGRLGLIVAQDCGLAERARFVRLTHQKDDYRSQATIVVGPAERPEREQWAVAHEIGECFAHRVFAALAVDPDSSRPDAREVVANHLASCLLLPGHWLAEDGATVDWDLLELKRRYLTCSHELIARRILEVGPPIVITVCDHGRVSWRRSNVGARPPRMLPVELNVWRESHATGLLCSATLDASAAGLEAVCCWPIHEPGWKREILQSTIAEW